MPHPNDADPPPKKYTFKARAFESVNPPAGAITGEAKIDVQDLFNAAAAPHRFPEAKVSPPPVAPVPTANDVKAMLRNNLAHEASKVLPPPVKLTRRRNDYILCLLGGNALIVGLVFLIGFNLATVLFGAAGVLMYSLMLTWIMWFIMEPY